jgi:demethylmenaquinone methyltransferase/2-methoxy-6-polyprenyl-1,4-benzoquinol methylase
MRILSRGRIGSVYDRVAGLVATPGCRVLDMGCGTGGVALACAARGASVVGIDLNAEMLEVARSKPVPFGTRGSVEWLQIGVAEIGDRFEPEFFDAITACLLMSELSPDEQEYVLAIAFSRLAPGGDIVLADEVLPSRSAQRLLYRIGRLPSAIVTYALSQATTRPVDDIAAMLDAAGFVEVLEERPWPAFAIVRGYRPLAAA